MYKKYFFLLLLVSLNIAAQVANKDEFGHSFALTVNKNHIGKDIQQVSAINEPAQSVKINNGLVDSSVTDTCPRPTALKIKDLCGIIVENKDVEKPYDDIWAYSYEKALWEYACVGFDEPMEVAKKKIKIMWDKYKTLFVCEAQGSVLKFSLNVSKTSFLDTMVSTYGLDINFIDPTDGKNLLDYFIGRYTESKKNNGIDHTKTKILKEYIDLIEALGGKSIRK